MKRHLVFLFFLIVCACAAWAQRSAAYIDSMKREIASAPDDTNKTKTLMRLCWDLRTKNPAEAEQYGFAALKLGHKLNFSKAIGGAYNNLGGLYETQGDQWKALQFYLKSLEVKRKNNDEKGIAASMNNVGIIYKKQEDYRKAIGYYKEAFRINIKTGMKSWQIRNLQNLCNAYKSAGNPDSAWYFNERLIALCKEVDDQEAMVDAIINKGNILIEEGKYRAAISCFDSSYKMARGLDLDDAGYFYFGNKGRCFLELNVLDSAEIFLSSAWSIKQKTNDWESIEFTAESLAELNKRLYNQRKSAHYLENAYKYLEIKLACRDSLLSYKKQRSISDMITQNLMNQKNEELKAIQQEKDISDLESRNRNLYIIMLLVVLAAIAAITFVVWKRLQRNRQLSDQLAEKNKEIMDSIHYAQRIQKSLLPSDKYIERVLKKK